MQDPSFSAQIGSSITGAMVSRQIQSKHLVLGPHLTGDMFMLTLLAYKHRGSFDLPITVGCKSFGRYVLLGFKQQQQDLIYNHLCLRK